MDIEKLIEQLNARGLGNGSSLGYHCGLFDDAATALSTLQAENEKLRAELEQVKRERDAAKSPEVLEAVDELMEFSRTRMSIGGWLCYVNVLGEWRGPQKEE